MSIYIAETGQPFQSLDGDDTVFVPYQVSTVIQLRFYNNNNYIDVAGTMSDTYARDIITGRGNSTTVFIEKTGQIRSFYDYAIDLEGTEQVVINYGLIDLRKAGHSETSALSFWDYMVPSAKSSYAYNYGTISSETIAVEHYNSVEALRVENSGTITSPTYAFISSGTSADTLINTGVIKGRIDLGNGKDYFDTRGGKIDGDVSGGVGDDIFVTDNARYKLVEIDGQGEDITRSTVSYKLYSTSFVERLELVGNKNINGTGTSRGEELWGNAGDNSLSGMAGVDGLDGKAGNDRLNGGLDLDADRFIFKTGYDHDTIVNFREGDRVFIGGWKAIENFADIRQHAHNEGNNVVIEAGNDSLTIVGLHKADLVAADFNFLL